MSLRPGLRVEAECAALDDDGAGVAKLGETALHVAGALPGERVCATVEHVSPHGRQQAWARLTTIERPSPDRVPAVCPAYGACGGCPLQHLAYAAQARWKRERVAAALAGHPALAAVPVAACVPSPLQLAYRNQAKYVYGRTRDGRLVLGAYVPRSHALVDMAGCRVVEPILDEVRGAILEVLAGRRVPPFDERARAGFLRYAVLRSNAAGGALVTLVTTRARWPGGEAAAREIRARAPAVIGVVQNVNRSTGNVLFGPADRVLDGAGTIEDVIGGARVELSSRAFFQINRAVAERAYDDIRRAAEALACRRSLDRAIDAYAGAGGIAFDLAPLAREVLAIEQNPAATAAAAAAAARMGLSRVRFVTADVAEALADVPAADLVVLNPPRSGCARAVLAAVSRLRPALVAYLSCDPTTLARDLGALVDAGFEVARVVPYDMLPHTPHVEALALMSRL